MGDVVLGGLESTIATLKPTGMIGACEANSMSESLKVKNLSVESALCQGQEDSSILILLCNSHPSARRLKQEHASVTSKSFQRP